MQFLVFPPGVYEIVIGGEGNTKTWIRNSTYGVNEVYADTEGILSADEHRVFWIKWAEGLVEVNPETFPVQIWNQIISI